MNRRSTLIIQTGLVILFFGSWEVGSRVGALDPFYFSSPSRILVNLGKWLEEGILFKNLWATLSQAAVGLILGTILGLVAGFLLAANRTVDAVLQPFVGVINALPRIAFAPLIILWLGFGFLSKVVIVISLVFFVVFFNTYNGFKDVSPTLLKNARVLGAKQSQVIIHIYLPAAMSWIFASLRLSVGYAIIASIIGEYIGASAGIGFLIDNAQAMFDSTGVMTGLVVLTITVAILDSLVRKVERHFAKWKTDTNKVGGVA